MKEEAKLRSNKQVIVAIVVVTAESRREIRSNLPHLEHLIMKSEKQKAKQCPRV